jgi:hypothetical protein
MAKTVSERTFTTIVVMKRDTFADYIVTTENDNRQILHLCPGLMRNRFPGLCRWFSLPRDDRRAKQQRVEVRLRVLPEETPKTPQG